MIDSVCFKAALSKISWFSYIPCTERFARRGVLWETETQIYARTTTDKSRAQDIYRSCRCALFSVLLAGTIEATLALFYHRIKAVAKTATKVMAFGHLFQNIKLIKLDVFSSSEEYFEGKESFHFSESNSLVYLGYFSLLYLHLYREVSRICASSVLLPHGTQESVLRVLLGLMVLWFFWYIKAQIYT